MWLTCDICQNSVFISSRAQFGRSSASSLGSWFSLPARSSLQRSDREICQLFRRGAVGLFQTLGNHLRMTDRDDRGEKASRGEIGIALGELAIGDAFLD